MGRLFEADERDPAIVLSYDAWQRDFGADPHILGRTVILESGSNMLHSFVQLLTVDSGYDSRMS